MNTQAHSAFPNARRQFTEDRAHHVIVRLDNAGFILEASANADCLGIDLEAQLLMPHIADFADPQYRSQVARYFVEVISGEEGQPDIEFPIAVPSTPCEELDPNDPIYSPVDQFEQQERYSLKLSCIKADSGEMVGAIGTLTPVPQSWGQDWGQDWGQGWGQGWGQDRELSEAHPDGGSPVMLGDRLTGLADRRCFASALCAGIANHEMVSAALFAIDGMRAIFMQYGQTTADEIRWGFARFLEAMVEPHYILTQIDDERFGVVLPGVRPQEAREWAREALETFSSLAMPAKGCKPRLSASAGIARAELSAEWTIRQAELGLVMARSAGGMQTAICRPHSGLASGSSIEQAMENVVMRSTARFAR